MTGRLSGLVGCLLIIACVEAIPRRTYKVTVKTSSGLDAGSAPHDRVFIKLYGDKHTTDFKELKGDMNAFQRNTVTTFAIDALDVGKIKNFEIKKTAMGKEDRWNLKEISVEDPAGNMYEAFCKCWLSPEQGLVKSLTPTSVTHKKTLNDEISPTKGPDSSPVPEDVGDNEGFSGPTPRIHGDNGTVTTTSGNGTTPTGNGNTPTGNGTTPTGNGTTPSGNGTTPTGNGSTPTGNVSPPVDSNALAKEILYYMNALRLNHLAGPLIKEKNMSDIAEKVVKKLTPAGSSRSTIDDEIDNQFGKLICSYSDTGLHPADQAKKCVSRWYETVKDYDWTSSMITPKTSEFVQLVWKESTHVGIAKTSQNDSDSYIIVLFDPPSDNTFTAKENISPVKDATDGSSQECPPGFSYYARSCYLYKETPASWCGAVQGCAESTAALASLDTKETNIFLSGFLSGKRGNGTDIEAWIGFNDRLQESRYQWTDGGSATFHAFLPTEPSGNGENCVAIKNTMNETGWTDNKCAAPLPYLCRKPVQAPITYKITILIESNQQPTQPTNPYYNTIPYTGYSAGGYQGGYPPVGPYGSYQSNPYGFPYGKKKSDVPKPKRSHIQPQQGSKKTYVPGLTDFVALIKKRMSALSDHKLDFVGDSSMIGSDSGYYVSVYLKEPSGSDPSPAQPLQDYLDANGNHLAPNNTANATIACVTIVCGGVRCSSQCSTSCNTQCSSSCCAGYNPHGTTGTSPYPAPSPYGVQYPSPVSSPYPQPSPYPNPVPVPGAVQVPYPNPPSTNPTGPNPSGKQGLAGCSRPCSRNRVGQYCPAFCPPHCCRKPY